jgi:hypothetical protein
MHVDFFARLGGDDERRGNRPKIELGQLDKAVLSSEGNRFAARRSADPPPYGLT